MERPSEQAEDSEAFYMLTQKGAEMAKRVAAGKVGFPTFCHIEVGLVLCNARQCIKGMHYQESLLVV